MPATAAHMELAFLTAEFAKAPRGTEADRQLLTAPDARDAGQNARRHELLYSAEFCGRYPLLDRIPPSTNWFEVRHLRPSHLNQLRVIAFRDWLCMACHSNELRGVARLCRRRGTFPDGRPLRLAQMPATWAPVILWGHATDAPLTIIEGNHRLVAYAATRWWRRPQLQIPAYVGLSAEPCVWHFPDGLF